jgi:hypothetical protein
MSIEAMKQALEALVGYELVYGSDEKDREAVRALRTAIEAAEKQQPLAWIVDNERGVIAPQPQEFVCSTGLCHYKPQREWVELTDDEMLMIYGKQHEGKKYSLGRMVEQALKEKNNVS